MYVKIREFLWVFFHPQFWIQNCLYNAGTDAVLDRLMHVNAEVINTSEVYTILKNPVNNKKITIWTANYPYAYGTISDLYGSGPMLGLAKRYTRYRFKEWLDAKRIQDAG